MTANNSFLQLAAPAGLRRGAGAPERALAAATCKCWPLVRARHSYNDKQGAMHVVGGVLLPSWRRHLDRHVGVPPPPFTLSVVSASLLLQITASTALIAVCCCCCCCCRQARQRRRRRQRTSGLLRPRGPTRGTRAVGMGPRCHYIQALHSGQRLLFGKLDLAAARVGAGLLARCLVCRQPRGHCRLALLQKLLEVVEQLCVRSMEAVEGRRDF